MSPLAVLRRRKGLSQRALALKAGMSYKAVQLLEAGTFHPRWSTLVKLRRALGLSGTGELLSREARDPARSAAETAGRMELGGLDAWQGSFFEFVDAFRRAPRLAAVERAPSAEPRVVALLASAVEILCSEAGLPAPWWCAGAPVLREPWFISGVESLKASALVESPPQFRQRNIFVLGNFLARA